MLKRRRSITIVIGLVLIVGVLAAPSAAPAWIVNYPALSCWSTANGLNDCRLGYTHALTFDKGSSVYLQNGVCVYSITAAGNIRGGGRVPCVAGTWTVNICYSSSTPNAEARTYAYVTDKYLTGQADDSPNHTGPCY